LQAGGAGLGQGRKAGLPDSPGPLGWVLRADADTTRGPTDFPRIFVGAQYYYEKELTGISKR